MGHSSPSWSLPHGPTCRVLGQLWPQTAEPMAFLTSSLPEPSGIQSGSWAPELTPGSKVRRAGLRGAKGPCSDHLGAQGALSFPSHTAHPISQQDRLTCQMSAARAAHPDSQYFCPVVSLDRSMGPLQGEPQPRAYCMGSEVQMALQDVAARTDVGELTQICGLLPWLVHWICVEEPGQLPVTVGGRLALSLSSTSPSPQEPRQG